MTVLEIGEDVWALDAYYGGDINRLLDAFTSAQARIVPSIELRMQIGLSRHCPVDYLLDRLEHFWGRPEFNSIDLYGDEFAQPIENFIPLYRQAKTHGLRLKAHVGEWGTAEDVIAAVKYLDLDEVQHGIAAVDSPRAIDLLCQRGTRLNITPTSNLKLGRVSCMSAHPIGLLFGAGVTVTLGSDDCLIFDSDVSGEYLKLYQSGVLTASQLQQIRHNGLRAV